MFNTLVKEAEKLGWTAEQAVIYCCENSWQGFKAAWVHQDKSKKDNIQDIFDRAI